MDWPAVVNRLLNILEELADTRTLLALIAFLGFFFIAWQVIQRLSNPPAAELFAVLNVTLALATGAAGFWFGVQAGSGRNSSGGGSGSSGGSS